VFKVLINVKHWWGNGRAPAATPVPYEVVCTCGRSSRGQRETRHQVVPCPGCGRQLFVLPTSPLPAIGSSAAKPTEATTPQRRWPVWFGPVVAGGLTLAVVVGIFAVVFSHLRDRQAASTRPTTADVENHVTAARQAVADGDFSHAAQQCATALKLLHDQPDLVPTAEQHRLEELHRQAAVLADWPRDSLDRLLGPAAQLKDEQFQRVVAGYRGKTVILDIDVRRDPAGHHHVIKHRPDGDATVRLQLDNLALLKPLPLADPQRLFFAVRLAGAHREGPGVFTAEFEPNSGVLLTDPEVGAKCSLERFDDVLRGVVQRQSKWLAGAR
jgi:hypothetical protein